jgi:hypothetical protein
VEYLGTLLLCAGDGKALLFPRRGFLRPSCGIASWKSSETLSFSITSISGSARRVNRSPTGCDNWHSQEMSTFYLTRNPSSEVPQCIVQPRSGHPRRQLSRRTCFMSRTPGSVQPRSITCLYHKQSLTSTCQMLGACLTFLFRVIHGSKWTCL